MTDSLESRNGKGRKYLDISVILGEIKSAHPVKFLFTLLYKTTTDMSKFFY